MRVPLSALARVTDTAARRRLRSLAKPAAVFELAEAAPATLLIADVRWEAYPPGWSFAESLAADLVAELPLEDKIGQLAIVSHRTGEDPLLPSEAADLGLGAIFGDSTAPPHDAEGNPRPDSPEVWAEFLRACQQKALAADQALPVLFGMDAVHGLALIPGATVFPHAIGLGASGHEALVRDVARATAREAAALGFRLTFSPTLAVARDERWGGTYESFSEMPEVVGRENGNG